MDQRWTRRGDRRRTHGLAIGAVCLALGALPGTFAQTALTPAQELIERERVRAAVEAAFSHYYQYVEDGGIKNDNMVTGVGMLEDLGPDAVPLLANELRQALRYNYTFVAYALGRIGGPEAEAALREAVEQAQAEMSDYATMRRAWACYALAMQGQLDALDLFNHPGQLAASHWIHMDMSALEAGAFLLGNRAVPVLHAQLDRYAQDEVMARERMYVLRALRRLAHPDSEARIVALLDDADPVVRREAADALHVYETPTAVDALVARLSDEPLPHVRFAAAWSLRQIAPRGMMTRFVSLLVLEQDIHVRGVLYDLVAQAGGKSALDALKIYLGAADPRDREGLIGAIRSMDAPGRTNVLRAALQDHDAHVMEHAAYALAAEGSEKALLGLLDQIDSGRWLRARWSLERLVDLREPRAVPRILARLAREMEGVVLDPLQRERIFWLGDALIDLRYTGSLDSLAEGLARQSDGQLKQYIEGMLARLDALATHGDDVEGWTAVATHEDEQLRRLAYERLGELGGEPAAKALAAIFGRVEREEGVAILLALADADTEASRALVERVLTQEAFDPFERQPLRSAAAWSARRLGGERMAAALEASVKRRHGRDGHVLVYYLVLQGTAGLPVYEAVRVPRMKYLQWVRGPEHETLQRLVADIRAGRTLDFYDVPPAELDFQRPR